MVQIAIDCMGGDYGPKPIIQGVMLALEEVEFHPILVGKEKALDRLLSPVYADKATIIDAGDVIGMHEGATEALKRKNSSIYKAIELVNKNRVQAVVSAGHSGATMSLAALKIGRIPGVSRPAIATIMPKTKGGKILLLDVGANVDCKPEHLVQFAIMGREYAKDVFGIQDPQIGLLSNGEEDTKGNEVTREALRLLRHLKGFRGNVEGNHIFDDQFDVIVCDGFVGNIVLKTAEGVAESIGMFIKYHVRKSFFAQAGALLLRKVFDVLKRKTDYAEYGGAPLLGVKSCVVIAHGKSNAKAIKNAIIQSLSYINSNVNADIQQHISSYSSDKKE